MLVVFLPIFVADTKIIFRYNFVAPLTDSVFIYMFLPPVAPFLSKASLFIYLFIYLFIHLCISNFSVSPI